MSNKFMDVWTTRSLWRNLWARIKGRPLYDLEIIDCDGNLVHHTSFYVKLWVLDKGVVVEAISLPVMRALTYVELDSWRIAARGGQDTVATPCRMALCAADSLNLVWDVRQVPA